MSSEITNTTVTFSPAQLATIEAAGAQAEQEIQQAAASGRAPPTGVWTQMYSDILSVAVGEGSKVGKHIGFSTRARLTGITSMIPLASSCETLRLWDLASL